MTDWLQDWRFLAAAGGVIAQAAITWQRVSALEKRVDHLDEQVDASRQTLARVSSLCEWCRASKALHD